LKCKKCEFRAHAGSCGAVVDPSAVESWLCDVCENEVTSEASLIPDCLLCPRPVKDGKNTVPPAPPDSYLHARKPTESQGWAHVLCSVFMPEITFTDASRLHLVEGASTISRHRWATKCSICGDVQGAVIRCCDCNKEYHASCAWRQGYKFGFEIQPVKSTRRDTTITTTFKGESGCMNAIVSCREHDHSRRDIYDICETNEGGETALQVYCQAYKQAAVTQAHGLLRKARRLDHILNIRSDTHTHHTESISPEPQCYRCQTEFAPRFYPAGDDRWICHSCQWIELPAPQVQDVPMLPAFPEPPSVMVA